MKEQYLNIKLFLITESQPTQRIAELWNVFNDKFEVFISGVS